MSPKEKKGHYVEPPMKFNPALQKFEPDLPIKRSNKNPEKSSVRWVLLISIIGVILLFIVAVFVIVYFRNPCIFRYQKDYVQLREVCDEAIQNDPYFGMLYYHRGIANLHLRDYEAAKDDFTRALSYDYVHESVYLQRGTAELHLDDTTSAVVDFTLAISLNPTDADAYQSLCYAETQAEDYTSAATDCSRAISLKESYGPYYSRGVLRDRMNDTSGAITDFDHAIKLEPDRTNAHAAKGDALMHAGNYSAAIASYDRAMQLGQNNSIIHIYRGITYLHWAKDQEALYEFTTAILLNDTLEPQRQYILYPGRALARIHLGDFDGGMADISVALSLNSTDVDSYDVRALGEIRLGKFDEAKKDLLTAIQLKPNYKMNLRRNCALNETISAQEAIDDCDKLLLLDPNDKTVMAWRSVAEDKKLNAVVS